jgi:autotransporter-associated beta strand protein/T5SS/PEP-CTERM-associated repeat protein
MRPTISSSTRILLRTGSLAALLAFWAGPAQADDGTWTLNGNGVWSAIGNWNNGVGPIADGAGSTADFSTIDLTGNRQVTIDGAVASRTVRILDIGLDTDTNGYQFLGSGGGTLTFDNGASAAQLNNLNTSSAQNARPLIQLPVLLNSDLEINNAGTNSTPANPLNLGTNIIYFNGQGLEGAATTGNTVYLSNVSTGTALVYGNFGNGKLNDGVNGGRLGVIQDSGTSTMYLNSNPVGNYSGGTFIKNGDLVVSQNTPGTGAITLGDAAGGSASLLLKNNNKNVTVTSAAQTLTLGTGAVGTLTLGGGFGYQATFAGLIDLNGETLTIAPDSATSTVALTANIEIDPIGDPGVFGGFKGTGTLVNGGAGTTRITSNMLSGTVTAVTQNSADSALVLSGTNTNTCTYTLDAGTLSFLKQASINGGTASMVPATVVVSTGTTLGLGVGTSPTYFDATDVATVLSQMSLPSGTNLGLDTSAGNFAFGNALGGAIGLTKLGNNTLTLSVASTYSGGTMIVGGTLEIGADDNLGASGTAVNFYAGGTLGTGAATVTLSRPVILNTGGGGFSNTAGGALEMTGTITGTEDLIKNGGGTMTLPGTKSLGGGLILDHAGSSGDAGNLVVLDGGDHLTTGAISYVGDDRYAHYNNVTVSDVGTTWTSNARLYVGNGGSYNTLTIDTGGQVNVNEQLYVGSYGGRPGNNSTVTVTGAGSKLVVSGSGHFQRGPNNKFLVTDAGYASFGGSLNFGNAGVLHNDLSVTGGGQLLTNGFIFSQQYSGGDMLVSGGSIMTNTGNATLASAGHVGGSTYTIDGAGTAWTNKVITLNSKNCILAVTNGAVMTGTAFSMGTGHANDIDNSATVTGGGLMQVGNSVKVGQASSTDNTLTAGAAGILQVTSATPTVVIGTGSGNAITISGGTLSYKDVFTVDMNANTDVGNGVSQFTWAGTNTLRLDNSDEIGVGAYTIANNLGATNFTGLELFDVTSVARALTLDGANGGTLRLDGATADLSAGGVTLGGPVTVSATGADSTLTGVLTGSGALVKTGNAKLTLASANTYSGNTTVSEGTLALDNSNSNNQSSTVTIAVSGAVLELAFGGTDTVDKLFIGATQMSAGVYGVGNIVIPQITGSGTLTVSSGPGAASPFSTWAVTKGLDGTAGKENGPNDNPDTDGQTNLREFGFDGDPLNGANNAKIFGLTEDSDFDSPDTAKEMILTVAVRAGTPAFSGSPSPTASHDGITYTIEGSTTLSSFPTAVNVVPTPITAGLPPVGAGYEYRSFSLAGSNGLTGKGFLHAKVTMP